MASVILHYPGIQKYVMLKVGDTLQGLVCCQVDDFFCTGSDMSKLVNNLKDKFNIGNEELNEFSLEGTVAAVQWSHTLSSL